MGLHYGHPLIVLLLLVSCGTEQSVLPREESLPKKTFYTIEEEISDDEEMEEWLRPYRLEYRKRMNRPLTTAEERFVYGFPESTLGNLVTDLIRYQASHEMRSFVDVAFLDRQDLHAELEEGVITVENLFELMPENHRLVVLEVKGESVGELANEIARKGGLPVSGIRMSIRDGSASGVLINAEAIDPDRTYRIATGSHIVDGGDFSSLEKPLERHDLTPLIRELLIRHLRTRDTIRPVLDLRIR